MSDTVSKEMLKTALAELAQTERAFFVALVSDALTLANASADTQGTRTRRVGKKSRKPLPAKVKPAYRQETIEALPGSPVDKSAIIALQELFAEAPDAEEIIASITK
jgi:hypothetical protein